MCPTGGDSCAPRHRQGPGLAASRRAHDDFDRAAATKRPVGQITSDLRKSCQSPRAKIFRFPFLEIGIINLAVSSPRRGVGRRH
jgi:hypothetical protein